MIAKRLILLLIAGCCAALAESPEKAVLSAETTWSKAVVASDTATLERVLGDDLTYGHASGNTDTKRTYIDRIKSGAQKYVSAVYDATPVVRMYGNIAVVNAVAKIASVTDGKPNASHLRMLHVYVKKDGNWQLVAHQSVRLAD